MDTNDSLEQKNYIVTEGYFKGGVIEGYEQNGKVIIATKFVYIFVELITLTMKHYRLFLIMITTLVMAAVSCQQELKEVPVSSVSLNKTSQELVVGESVQLNATVNPSEATEKTVTWSSSNSAVATVVQGKVTAVSEGTATITATAGGESDACIVTVVKEAVRVSSVELSKTFLEIKVGESETITASVSPSDATDKSIVWTSSDSSVASVEQGVITAVSLGTAVITAQTSNPDISASCSVTVVPGSTEINLVNILGYSVNTEAQTLTIQLATDGLKKPFDETSNGYYLSLEIPSSDGYLHEGDPENNYIHRFIQGYDSYGAEIQYNVGTCVWQIVAGQANPTKIIEGTVQIYCDEENGYVWHIIFNGEGFSMYFAKDIPELTSPVHDDNPYRTDKEIIAVNQSLYTEYASLAYNLKLLKAMLTDDVYAAGGFRGDMASIDSLNEFTYDSSNEVVSGLYSGLFNIVGITNSIIDKITQNSLVAQTCIAEAHVIRALCYFDLITLWGTPPLIDHVPSPLETSFPNGSRDLLWAFVEKDLLIAIESGYLKEKSGLNDVSCRGVTKQFAQALLGKAYLWMGNIFNDASYFGKSASAFDAVVSSGKYSLYNGDYEEIRHAKHNCENIFESDRDYDPDNPGNLFGLYDVMVGWRSLSGEMDFGQAPYIQGWGFRVPRHELYDAFVKDETENGYRLCQTMLTYTQLKELWGCKLQSSILSDGLFMRKQLAHNDESYYYGMCCSSNYLWMRFAEVLLCGAEAHFMCGNISTAQTYLDQIRSRAKLNSVPVSLDVIKTEKRLELCVEGVRFQDLIRWGDAVSALKDNGKEYPIMQSNGIVTYYPTGNMVYGFKEGKHELLPFPLSELQINPGLIQNPGW